MEHATDAFLSSVRDAFAAGEPRRTVVFAIAMLIVAALPLVWNVVVTRRRTARAGPRS